MKESKLTDNLVVEAVGMSNVSKDDQPHKERDRFNTDFQYLLGVLGFAAGFGSVWRFPYLVFKSGGGVFLIPYFIMFVLIGLPAFYLETSLGQMFQKGPPQIFQKIAMKWKGLGFFAVFVNLSMSTYYNLILAYSLYYLFKSFSFPLPWALDDIETRAEPWNKEYFYEDFLNSSSGLGEIGSIVWPIFFCYVISLVIVFCCIQNGVQVSGKITLFTSTSPYILLLLLMLRGIQLDGAWEGISYLFSPDWSKLWSASVWVDAAVQVAFQVSTGSSVVVFFGSYRNPNQELKKTCLILPLLTVVCGFLASLVIFSFMGYMSIRSGIPINQIPLSGPDLAFVVFPAVLSMMPLSNLLSMIFFLTMVFLGIDTQFAFVDCLAGAIEDEFDGKPVQFKGKIISMRTVRLGICVLISLTGLLYSSQAGFYYLGFIDSYGIGINLIATVFMESVFFTWKQDWKIVETMILSNTGQATPNSIKLLMKYTLTTLTGMMTLFAIILQLLSLGQQPWWCSLIGWFFTLYPYATILYYYQTYKSREDESAAIQQSDEEKRTQELVEF